MRYLPLSSKSIRSSSSAWATSNGLSLAYVVRHCESISSLDPEGRWAFWQLMHTALKDSLLMRDVRETALVETSTADDPVRGKVPCLARSL